MKAYACIYIIYVLIFINQVYFFFKLIGWSFFHKTCVWNVTFGWGNTRVSKKWLLPSGRKYSKR